MWFNFGKDKCKLEVMKDEMLDTECVECADKVKVTWRINQYGNKFIYTSDSTCDKCKKAHEIEKEIYDKKSTEKFNKKQATWIKKRDKILKDNQKEGKDGRNN